MLFALEGNKSLVLQTRLAPSAAVSQTVPRLNSDTAKLPKFQTKDSGPGQVPLLAPPPAPQASALPSQLSGVSGKALMLVL